MSIERERLLDLIHIEFNDIPRRTEAVSLVKSLLRTQPAKDDLIDLLDGAWHLLARVGAPPLKEGGWKHQGAEWQQRALLWRDKYTELKRETEKRKES